jgi:hypothetical protein
MRRRLLIVAVNVVVFLVLAEIVSLVVYYIETGALFYTHHKTYELIPETREGALTADALNPYFGPTHKPGYPFDIPPELRDASTPAQPVATNNFGFVSPYAYPFAKERENQFVIGIFGGSVGVWFCQLGAARLVHDLAQHAAFANKEIVPLCLSHEGYKQPQQLLVLAYFLSLGQVFDLVINIDGFNEVAISPLNDKAGWDISMPSVLHLDPLINLANQSTLSPEKLRALAAIARYKQQLNDLAARLPRARIAFVNLLLEKYRQRVMNNYRAEVIAFGKLPSVAASSSVIQPVPAVHPRDEGRLFTDAAAAWVNASIAMRDMLAARDVPYFHFLQPNQYYSKRRFTTAEAAAALSSESAFKPGAEKGYPYLVSDAASGTLKGRHVNFFDATHIFDSEPSPVYMDNCCHYTLRGNHLLADFIASSITSVRR